MNRKTFDKVKRYLRHISHLKESSTERGSRTNEKRDEETKADKYSD